MARLPYLGPDDVAPTDRDLLARNLNLYRALVHSPDGARAFAAPALYVRHHSALDPRLREFAIVQVGYVSRAPYEYAHHVAMARDLGFTDADILAIAHESRGEITHLDELERAVLAAARELAAGTTLQDATYAQLAARLEARELVDLIVVICTYCGVVRLLGALEIDLEPDYRHFLEKFPLPPATD